MTTKPDISFLSSTTGLDPTLITLPNVMRATRSMRRQYRAWERGEDSSPSETDLLVGISQALDVYFPYDAIVLAEDELFEAASEGATLPQLAVIALRWANRNR